MEHDDVIIIVCLDDVASRQMTSAMMAVLKTMTYIQWDENNRDAVRAFWGRLQLAINDVFLENEHVVWLQGKEFFFYSDMIFDCKIGHVES